jgi:two-component system phosphate regulon sensor histidine kinase PhoR
MLLSKGTFPALRRSSSRWLPLPPAVRRAMFSSRLFWKLVLTCAGLNLLAAVAVGLILSSWLHDQVVDPVFARRWIWGLVAVESVCVFGLAYWLIGHIIRPVASLNEAADAIAAGDYEQRVYVPSRDELGMLAGTLNRMSQALGIRMTQLSQTAARQSTALGGMIEGVIAVDARQRIVLANEAAGRLYGFRPAEIEGRALLEVVRNHALHAAVTTGLSSGQPQRIETQRVGTQKLHVEIHVQPLPGEPCPGVVLVIHDTTELRRLESIRRDFVANVSHELKTPLSSIKAYTETLQNGADAETTQRFLARIEEQADRLHHLILDMLMLARIESDHQAFEIVSVDVAEVVHACLESQRPAAEAKRITVNVQPSDAPIDASSPCRVRADREGLREILDNLVDNAIKYTSEGGAVTIAWRSKERGARSEDGEAALDPRPSTLILSVTDTGIGIKPQDQERVFERFYRVDKARSRELGGTGLGLSIVKHLVQAFGGKVAVESTPGQGSTFTVALPAG